MSRNIWPLSVLVLLAGCGNNLSQQSNRVIDTYKSQITSQEEIASYDFQSNEPADSAANIDYSDDDQNDQLENLMHSQNLQSEVDDLSYEINKLKRNVDLYDAEEFARKIKRLENQADDLSGKATDLDIIDAAASLDDTSSRLRRLRRDIDWEQNYFYKEKEDEMYTGLKRSANDAEDASSSISTYSLDLETE